MVLHNASDVCAYEPRLYDAVSIAVFASRSPIVVADTPGLAMTKAAAAPTATAEAVSVVAEVFGKVRVNDGANREVVAGVALEDILVLWAAALCTKEYWLTINMPASNEIGIFLEFIPAPFIHLEYNETIDWQIGY